MIPWRPFLPTDLKADGVQCGQRQGFGRRRGHGDRFGIDDGGNRVEHNLQFRSVRVRKMWFQEGLARRRGMERSTTRAAVIQHDSHVSLIKHKGFPIVYVSIFIINSIG